MQAEHFTLTAYNNIIGKGGSLLTNTERAITIESTFERLQTQFDTTSLMHQPILLNECHDLLCSFYLRNGRKRSQIISGLVLFF